MKRHSDALPAASCGLLTKTALLLVVATALPGQYFSENLFVPMQPPGGGLDYFTIAADFNQNGSADLIHCPANYSYFMVDLDPALGGAGPPYAQQLYGTVGWWSASRAVAVDANADGILDLVYDSMNSLCTSIGIGNGTFIPPSTCSGSVANIPHWMGTTDVNNDGLQDILVYSSFGIYLPLLTCYLNAYPSWTQSWQVPMQFVNGGGLSLTGGGPRLGDFDGDGNQDVAVQILPPTGGPLVTNVLWGNGMGQFSLPNNASVPGFVTSAGNVVTSAFDMDGDGIMDLISSQPTTVGGAASELLQVHLGSATRVFAPAGTFIVPGNGTTATTVAADFNRDGYGDLLRAPAFSPTPQTTLCNFAVTLVVGLPAGQLHQTGMDTPHTQWLTPSPCPSSLVADFDGDRDLDLMCTPRFTPLWYFRNAAVIGVGCSGTIPAPLDLRPGGAVLGNTAFSISINGALVNAHAVLAIATGLSASPLTTCGNYLDLAAPAVFLAGFTNTLGDVVWQLPIPISPLLHGVEFRAQAAILDPLGPNMGGLNLALTPARTIIVW